MIPVLSKLISNCIRDSKTISEAGIIRKLKLKNLIGFRETLDFLLINKKIIKSKRYGTIIYTWVL